MTIVSLQIWPNITNTTRDFIRVPGVAFRVAFIFGRTVVGLLRGFDNIWMVFLWFLLIWASPTAQLVVFEWKWIAFQLKHRALLGKVRSPAEMNGLMKALSFSMVRKLAAKI